MTVVVPNGETALTEFRGVHIDCFYVDLGSLNPGTASCSLPLIAVIAHVFGCSTTWAMNPLYISISAG